MLLLGVGYDSNTAFHLAEYRIKERRDATLGAPILKNGERVWITYRDIILDADCFDNLGEAFERDLKLTTGKVGSASARLVALRKMVDYAVGWMENRTA